MKQKTANATSLILNELEAVRTTMSMRLMDTCAILAAIESMIANAGVSIKGEDGRPDCTVHTLTSLALEKAREADSLSDELESILVLSRRAA